jgi:hypothetical protein
MALPVVLIALMTGSKGGRTLIKSTERLAPTL